MLPRGLEVTFLKKIVGPWPDYNMDMDFDATVRTTEVLYISYIR